MDDDPASDQTSLSARGDDTQTRTVAVHQLLTDRHALDAIARAIVTGERGLGGAGDAIADAVASLMINRLQAAGVAGHQRVAHLRRDDPDRRPRVERLYSRELLEALIRRTDKHLAHAAMLALTLGDS
jgi:hypothetical protein